MSGSVGIACQPKRATEDGRLLPLAACMQAIIHVKAAGFSLSWSSRKSEACYYTYPGRWGVLRIATHSKGGKNPDFKDGPTLVSVTFPDVNLRGFTPQHVENQIANAIGLYLIRAEKR